MSRTLDERFAECVRNHWCNGCQTFHGMDSFFNPTGLVRSAEAGDELAIKMVAYIAQEKLRGNSSH